MTAFARPHELKILTEQGVKGTLAAQIERILPFGSFARVELRALDQVSTTQEVMHYEVELAKHDLLDLSLFEGQNVWLQATQLKVFETQGAV